MINPKKEIAKLKNGSSEYNKAIDDVLNLLDNIHKSCRIIHFETGLFFNGYDNSFPKGKNTLSRTNAISYMSYGKTDSEILEMAFGANIIKKENGERYVRNKIIYSGSDINKILLELYEDTAYIPLTDFNIKRQ